MDRKEQIILATLDLASVSGLGNVSLQMIADKVGIRKASLFNHFSSKEELIEAMYVYLRAKATEKKAPLMLDESLTAEEILNQCYSSYRKLCMDENLMKFYKLIYSERCFSASAAQIMKEETDRMVKACAMLLSSLRDSGKLKIENPEEEAASLAFTLHGYLEYELDSLRSGNECTMKAEEYLRSFCMLHQR